MYLFHITRMIISKHAQPQQDYKVVKWPLTGPSISIIGLVMPVHVFSAHSGTLRQEPCTEHRRAGWFLH